MNTYRIDYYAWIPGYNDFDQSDVIVEAESEAQAWCKFNLLVKFVKNAHITKIN